MYLSKKEAAEYLNVSERAIARYAQQGKISVKYVKGKNGKEAKYPIEELNSFKSHKDIDIHRPKIEPLPSVDSESQEQDQGLSTLGKGFPSISPVNQERLIQAFENIALSMNNEKQMIDICHKKLLLTIDEVKLLTGLSRDNIKKVIDSRKLKAKKIGRSWRIKKKDLEAYINNL